MLSHPCPSRAKVYVIVPVTIPGMKKSFFYENFARIVKENNFGFDMISIKQVKKEFAENFARKHSRQKFTQEELNSKVERPAKLAFKARLGELIKKSANTTFKAHFIYIDKNHPPSAFVPTFEVISQNSEGMDLEVIALVPFSDSEGLTYLNDKNQTCYHPLSANLFLTCFNRVRTRKVHETLVGKGIKSALVSLYFLNMFKHIRFDNDFLTKNQFHKLFFVPFSDEANSSNVSKDLVKALIDTLKSSNKEGDAFDDKRLGYFNNLYEKMKPQFADPTTNDMEVSIRTFLKKEIFPEVFRSQPFSSLNQNSKEISNPKPENMEEKKVIEDEINLNYEFKPRRIPCCLGIFPSKLLLQEVKEYILSGLNQIKSAYAVNQDIEETLKDLQAQHRSNFTFIEDSFINSFYIGENKERINTEFYKKFKPDERVDIILTTLVIVPGNLVIGLCNPEDLAGKTHDEYPHMTLMKGGEWILRPSICMLEELFKSDSLKASYKSGEMFKVVSFIKEVSVELSQEPAMKAYIVKTDSDLIIPGETRSSTKPSN